MNEADIIAWQEDPFHLDPLGLRLEVDGNLGPKTRWSMAFESITQARRAFVIKAWMWRGVVEIPRGSNTDPQGKIQAALTRCWCKPGSPWCAAAACDWLSPVVERRIGGALRLVDSFPRVDNPFCGDLAAYPTDDKGAGHVFMVLGREGDTLLTWEANCDNQVRCCLRTITPEMRFGRTWPDISGTMPGIIKRPFAGGGTR